MIASIRGKVIEVSAESAVLEVGGLGLAVQCTPATLAELRRDDVATVHTSLVVREDSLTLYAFTDADERSVFEVLQTVSGVGPRLAQAMLATLRPDALRRSVAKGDVNGLTQIPGVGKKGAQRLVLELKDKLGAPIDLRDAPAKASATGATDESAWRPQVHAALVGLGWNAREAETALVVVAEEHGDAADDAEIGDLLRTALRSMTPAGVGR
jgi:Holliday junction DNA helicase RuvA